MVGDLGPDICFNPLPADDQLGATSPTYDPTDFSNSALLWVLRILSYCSLFGYVFEFDDVLDVMMYWIYVFVFV